MQSIKPIAYKTFGNFAVLIDWQTIIDEHILNDMLQFKNNINHHFHRDIQDIVIGYNSLTVIFKDEIENFSNLKNRLQEIYRKDSVVKKEQHFLWEIPVCYDMSFGIDLEEISLKSGLSINEIVRLHSKPLYTVFFIGFLPGFLYLGGLDEQLFFDRRPDPRLKVEKGTVAIGGKQTGVYPEQSAGGWNCIGKTPISFFNVNEAKPCFAKSGDKIKFVSISKEEFSKIDQEISNGNFTLTKTILDA